MPPSPLCDDANGACYVSMVIFDNVSEVLHDRVRLAEVNKMIEKEYTVRGATALIDAIATRIMVEVMEELQEMQKML